MTRLLFLCSKNRWRSPTAEEVFSSYPGVECASAGVSRDAEVPVSAELLAWADLIFVMEKAHQAKLAAKFGTELRGKRVVCLNIPDRYRYMDPALVQMLERKVGPHLPGRA